MIAATAQAKGTLPADVVLCSVPCTWMRRHLRGYNQADLLAWSVAHTLGLPARRLLRRRRFTGSQTQRSRSERLAAQAGAPRRRHAPHSRSGHFKERSSPREEKSGSGVQDRRLSNYLRGAVSRTPPAFLPYRRGRRHSRRAASVRARSFGLITQHATSACRTGAVPSTLIRFMTRVPARAMATIMREVQRVLADQRHTLY